MARSPIFPAKLMKKVITLKVNKEIKKSEIILKENYPNHKLNNEWDLDLEQFTAKDMIEFAIHISRLSLQNASKVVYEKYNGGWECKKDIISEKNIELLDK